MNRTHHLKQTLLKNLIANVEYPLLEIILLDYNSKDDMEKWAKEELYDYIEKGEIIYYKTFDPPTFNHSHAKNLAFKLANGTIVCNINADNFTGTGFATYINSVFQKNLNTFLRPELGTGFASGTVGVVCVNKSDFLKVGGFDERMSVYGWEDVDFVSRLNFSGLTCINIKEKRFLDAIDHGVEEKYNTGRLLSKIHEIYISSLYPLEQSSSKLLILYKNQTFKLGTVINNLVSAFDDPDRAQDLVAGRLFEFELEEYFWIEGIWQEGPLHLKLFNKDNDLKLHLSRLTCQERKPLRNGNDDITFYHTTDIALLSKIACFEIDYANRLVFLDNQTNRKITANNGIFGQARVFKNFDYETAIEIK